MCDSMEGGGVLESYLISGIQEIKKTWKMDMKSRINAKTNAIESASSAH